MKVYRLDFDFNNNEAIFDVEGTFDLTNSKFSKDEISNYLNGIELKYFSFSHEISMRERKNIPLYDLKEYIYLITEDKINQISDIMYISGFGDTILLSLKAKEYIQKKYKDKNIEYIDIFYKNIPLYIMNVLESEICYMDNTPQIDYEYMLDFSKIKNNDIFRAREIGRTEFAIGGIYCNENFKKYIEESDLKGYRFIEIKDINDKFTIVEEDEYIFKEESMKEFYSNGSLKYEGTIFKGYRINNWKYYYENGNLKMEGNFGRDEDELGEQIGEWKYYYESGRLKAVGSFKKGKKVGVFKTYNEDDGSLFLEQYYTTGLKDDLIKCKFYYKNGQVEKEGTAYERNNWEITGEWRYYDLTGKLEKIQIFNKNDLIEEKIF